VQILCKFSLSLKSYNYQKMNTNIVISLDTRREKKDKTYPLVMRLGHNERTTSIPIGISLFEKDWDSKNRVVRKSYTGVNTVTRLNNLIQKKKSDAMDVIIKLHELGALQALSLAEVRDKIDSQDKPKSFFAFADSLVKELAASNRIGTSRSYGEVVNVVRKYCGGKDLPFLELSYNFLSKFEAHHLGKGNTYNGLAVYMRTIRAIFNKAIKAGYIEKEYYPFDQYKIRTTPTEKRALEWELLKKIIELNLKASEPCFNARNYFVASYMMYGMNYTDMAFLKKEDIVDGRVLYRRKKTSKLYDIKVTPGLSKILSYYISLNEDSEYVFPIIKRESLAMQYKDIKWARKRYNKELKTLAETCGIDKNLTSYVSRHSFATQAMLQQVPLNAISTMLGHSSLKTTEVYLKSLPSSILDDYNLVIVNY
jgi:integrase/recombinase XerD